MNPLPFGLIHLLAGLLALGVATVATPLVGRLAGRVGLVAYPKRDRWHTTPTPLMGGVAIFAGSIPLVVLLSEAVSAHMLDRFAALLIGAVLIFALGLIDDLKTLPPYAKLLGQIVAACILVASMPIGRYLPWSVLMVPIMIFWIVGVTNAFNLLDNMDGLSAGIAAIVSITLFAFNFVQGDHQTALLCIVIAGACGGFLIFNFNPARIFMGDCGSLLIGYVLSGIVLLGAAKAGSELALTLLVPVGVMALPILDTTLVTIVRSLHHRPISLGGRDHLSHRLVALGLNERSAVLVLYAVSLLFGSLAIASNYVSGPVTVLLGSLLVLGIGFFGIYLGQVRIYSEADYQRISSRPGVVGKLVLGGSWLYKRQIAEMVLDLTLICLGLLAAYLIRFEGTLERHYVEQYATLLPWIVSIKLVTLFAMGVYRSVWRYMGTSDLLRLVVASSVGSVLAFAAIQLAFRGEGGAPRAVLMVDLIVVTALLIAARMSFVLIRDILARLRKRDLVRVLIVGAGDTGELVLRAMARSRSKAYRVVGFLDDNVEMRDRSIHGVRVLGPSSTLAEVADRQHVEEVVLTTNHYADDLLAECRKRGITLRDVGAFFRSQLDGEAEKRPAGVGAR
jgi:UDP-GlcNAc:undecaprenyl-phosphate/decaprenyl-phosphate GlcNAc-1-phosphate transferase